MRHEQFNFSSGEEVLSGVRIVDKDSPQPKLLFLHGGGSSTKERFFWLAEDLLEKKIGSILFDFSGHGQSTGEISSSSLAKRTEEAKQAAQEIYHPIAVLGSSMGAYVAIQLTQCIPTHTLILFNPAIYTREAWNTPFTEDFTRIIQKTDSWRDSDALEILENFKGNLLVAIGEDDEVIPQEVITLLDKHSPSAKRKEIFRIPKCTHNLHQCFAENPDVKEQVINIIVEIVESVA